MGGYADDQYPHGALDANFYTITDWSYIDYFVYFSHHLVTIPPVGWIDAAHKHGVKVGGLCGWRLYWSHGESSSILHSFPACTARDLICCEGCTEKSILFTSLRAYNRHDYTVVTESCL